MTGRKDPGRQTETEQLKAVALGFDQEKMNAPQVVAAGRGYVAERILDIAREYHIPVKQDPVLAEALGQLDLGQEIPSELYRVVAEILVFIMETDRKQKMQEVPK